MKERVLIAGAGPVGLVAAANLVRHGVPVTVLEAGSGLSEESRASTFHPPTLDMLAGLGAAQPLIAQGLTAPRLQYRTKAPSLLSPASSRPRVYPGSAIILTGRSRKHPTSAGGLGRGRVLAEFDFGAIADVTGHPYRLQCEQHKLTCILAGQLRSHASFELQFDSPVKEVTEQRAGGVEVAIERRGHRETRSGRWLIGADGARSDVRRSLGIAFEGFTWPERFLVVSTPFDFRTVIPDLVEVTYVADPERWHFLLQIPGLCRVMFPIAPGESDELALSPDFAQSLMATIVPGISPYEIAHVTLYKVHQRVANTFQRGRVFLAGDAAHINNPLGGMGMNGGIHDAINLTSRLVEVWNGSKPESELERYDRQRRLVTLEYIEKQSIQNKRNLESDGVRFGEELRDIAANEKRNYDFLLRVSMIASLRRAQELG